MQNVNKEVYNSESSPNSIFLTKIEVPFWVLFLFSFIIFLLAIVLLEIYYFEQTLNELIPLVNHLLLK